MLSAEDFILYAYKHYNNPQCIDIEEFHSDLKRFKYLKKLINRYLETGEFSDRLILNHLTVIFNLFGTSAAKTMLLYKMDDCHWPVIKACLNFLGYVYPNEFKDIDTDVQVQKVLERI